LSLQSVLLPVFVLVGVAFCLLFRLGFLRVGAARTEGLAARDIAFCRAVWPDRVVQVEKAFTNQFELPILFYILVVLAIITRKYDFLFVILEWLFVILRLVHAGIHITSNELRLRFQTFAAGALVLLAMWLIVATRILGAL
jgi:hypothetical protein